MADQDQPGFGRRPFIAGSATLLGTILAHARPAGAQSAARRGTLVIGLDVSDALSLDPARVFQYSNPLPTHAAYEGLVTYDPNDAINLKPAGEMGMRTVWIRTDESVKRAADLDLSHIHHQTDDLAMWLAEWVAERNSKK